MGEKVRKSGIDVIGGVPWGMHLCQFYQSKEDLLDILVPYFKEGLENNEFCMWITSEPLDEEEAKKAMRKVLSNFDYYLEKGQIEIIPHSEWYLKGAGFDPKIVPSSWIDKLNDALAKGYEGMRVTGNIAWLEKRDWKSFTDYEKEVNNAIGEYQMLVICTYSLDKCGAVELIDVVGNHQFALIRREGKWELIESSERKGAEEKLKESEKRFRRLFEQSNDAVFIHGLDGEILNVNSRACEMAGYDKDTLLQMPILALHPQEELPRSKKAFETTKDKGSVRFESKFKKADGTIINVEISSRIIDPGKGMIQGIVRDITERKQAQQALREGESKYRALFENILGGYAYCKIVLDDNDHPIDFVYLEVNDAFERLTGLKREDVLGKKVTEAIPGIKDSHPELFDIYGKVALTGKATKFDIYFEPLEIWLSISVYSSRKGYFVAVFDNITERKKAEMALRASEERTRTIFESSPNAITVTDLKGTITECNQATLDMHGFSAKKELIGVDGLELIAEKDRQRALENMKKTLEKSSVKNLEYTMLAKDGREFLAELSASVIRDSSGKPTSFVAITKDITQRRRIEEEIKRGAEGWKRTFNAITDFVSIQDKDFRFIRLNKPFADALKAKPKDLIGKRCYEIFHKSDKPWPNCPLREVFKDGKIHTAEVEDPNIGLSLSITGSPIVNERGQLIGAVHIAKDITGQKKAEKVFIRSEKLKALGEMAGGVAHDFNNLLAIILGNAQLLEKGLERYKPEEIKERLRIIVRTAGEGGETVKRLQHFSQRKVSTEDFTDLDLNEIVRDAIASTSPRWKDEAEAKGTMIKIKEELGELPVLWGSRSGLMEVLTNLIFNALDAMSKGGEIIIKTESEEKEVLLHFTDNGKGIPKRVKDKVFEPFFTTKGPKASGLGLSVSYGIVKRHQGEMKVESSEKKGTTFTISIPIFSRAASGEKKVAVPKKILPKKILVIDDEVGIGDVLKMIFQDEGHQVVLAKSARQGLDKFKQDKFALAFTGFEDKFDLVLTDLGMSGMSGWQLAKEIKKIDPDMPVGLITGWTVPTTKEKMKEQGVDFILFKPFDYSKVVKEVNAVLKSKTRQPSPAKNKQRLVSGVSAS